MKLWDALALWGRRYEQQRVLATGNPRFSLREVLDAFDRYAVLELRPYVGGKALPVVRPDTTRKTKVSLLDDGISAIRAPADGWWEVYRTAPTGDLSRVKVVARAADESKVGEVHMLIGPRTYDHYFREDPLLAQIEQRATS